MLQWFQNDIQLLNRKRQGFSFFDILRIPAFNGKNNIFN